MTIDRLKHCLRDDRGGGTILGLFWFMVLVAFCGLAVDVTNGFRNRTILQATADAAALAGAIDLPNQNAAVATAVNYSSGNMAGKMYGDVLKPEDVVIGTWNKTTRKFTPGGALPDSVYVRLRQTASNSNAVPVNFLRIIGLTQWEVNAQAIAQRFIPECLNDGLIARGIVDISSNNGFVNRICVHGQKGVHMQNHNSYQKGVTVSMPKPASQLVVPTNGMQSNPGLPEALRQNRLDPRMVNHINEIMTGVLNRQAYVMPNYINANRSVITVDDKFVFNTTTYTQGRVYRVQCNPNKQVSIANNAVIQNVAIISECGISVGSNATLINTVLGSTALGNGPKPLDNSNINFSSNVNLGAPDNCQPGGGVQIFSSASVLFSSSMRINGLQVVAAGNVELGARDQGINGISVQAGQDIKLTSNNMFGLCSGGAPNLFTVNYYRLVH